MRERGRSTLAIEALSLHHIDAGYGQSQVLHDLSLGVGDGRVLALLGRNGVGKTTCISTIIGFVRPRCGEILLCGEPITGLPPERIAARGVGLVPQGRRVFPTLTVRENLTVAARPPRAGSQTTWTLSRVFELFPRLGERQGNLGANLSGGELQMLAIGRGLMTNPRVLLLDEPSEGLAPLVVHELGATLQRLKRERLSVLLVEQNSALALGVADDALILGAACVDFQGPIERLKADPALLDQHLGVS
ncbi:MAG: ABC transporter ATP-binding protein [Hyphomicrobiales bacterium]|nr:ABC transporter ATP-binding protein [Hyphomicrobiales bacterium]